MISLSQDLACYSCSQTVFRSSLRILHSLSILSYNMAKRLVTRFACYSCSLARLRSRFCTFQGFRLVRDMICGRDVNNGRDTNNGVFSYMQMDLIISGNILMKPHYW
jgi:hypothetical protein